MLLNLYFSFKSEEAEQDCALPQDIKDMLWNFHMDLLYHCGELIDETEDEKDVDSIIHINFKVLMLYCFKVTTWKEKWNSLVSKIKGNKKSEEVENGQEVVSIGSFQELVTDTMIRWTDESQLECPNLVREMFAIVFRQYDGVGEV